MSINTSMNRNQKAKLATYYNDLLKELASPKINTIGCYTLKETIGKGSYGKVKLGVHQLTCRLVAIKKISKKHAHLMAREIHHHRQLQHPNIVALYEIICTETNIYIVSEHCSHGDLFDALSRQGRFTEENTRTWFIQLLDAVQYCHSLGIIHRDLKLENILLDEFDQVKICDFGFARQTDKNQMLQTFCGSLAYSAPEVIQRQSYSGPATDIWSLGVILYTLLAGELPFDDDCETALQRKVVNMEYIIPNYFPTEVTDLLFHIFKFDPFNRIKMKQILAHSWIKNNNTPLTSSSRNQHANNSLLVSSASSNNILCETTTAKLLLNAGFNKSVVEKMKLNHFGTLGTLWTFLLMSKKRDTTDQHQHGWFDSLKSWFNKEQQQPQETYSSDGNQFINNSNSKYKNTTTTSFIKPYSIFLPLTPITNNACDELNNNSSTCSSTTTMDDDSSSIDSSPATSVDQEGLYNNNEEEERRKLYMDEEANGIFNNMNAFHRVSPMPSRADILIPRSRLNNAAIVPPDTNIEEQRHDKLLRKRLLMERNKVIVEEDEEE